MILYQILNTLTGKKLYYAWQGTGRWGDAGAYWKKPDTVSRHLKNILYDFKRYEEKKFWGIDKGYRPSRFREELAPHIKIIATEMQTIGASQVYGVEHFMDGVQS